MTNGGVKRGTAKIGYQGLCTCNRVPETPHGVIAEAAQKSPNLPCRVVMVYMQLSGLSGKVLAAYRTPVFLNR